MVLVDPVSEEQGQRYAALAAVKRRALSPTPAFVLTAIFPEWAPAGTLATIFVVEGTRKVAFTPPNLTHIAPPKFLPVSVTCVPALP